MKFNGFDVQFRVCGLKEVKTSTMNNQKGP